MAASLMFLNTFSARIVKNSRIEEIETYFEHKDEKAIQAVTAEFQGELLQCVCVSVCVAVCVSLCVSLCMSVCVSVCLCV